MSTTACGWRASASLVWALPSYVPPRLFRQLRQLTRYRRKLVDERSRARNRVHKTLDHDGLRLGGVLSDIFGVNGRRILDGLVAGHSPRYILANLTHHVAAKLAPLTQALAATLDPLALFALGKQMEAVDRADTALVALDKRIRTVLADYQRALRLLQTIPGIDYGSACTILAEIGPDLGAFRKACSIGPWAGVAPGNNSSAGKRRSGRARKGIRRCVPRWPSAPTGRCGPRVRSSTAITGCWPGASATKRPSSPVPTSCCE